MRCTRETMSEMDAISIANKKRIDFLGNYYTLSGELQRDIYMPEER